MTKRLQNINVMRASDLKTFRTFAAKLRHNMHDVLKLSFGLRAKCLWRMIKELGMPCRVWWVSGEELFGYFLLYF